MRDFICPNCGQHLAFENSVCLSCRHPLGFSLEDMALLVIASGEESAQPGFVDADEVPAVRQYVSGRMQLARRDRTDPEVVHLVCAHPNPARTTPTLKALAAFAEAERAKRRLIAELVELKLPIVGGDENPRATAWRSICSPVSRTRCSPATRTA